MTVLRVGIRVGWELRCAFSWTRCSSVSFQRHSSGSTQTRHGGPLPVADNPANSLFQNKANQTKYAHLGNIVDSENLQADMAHTETAVEFEHIREILQTEKERHQTLPEEPGDSSDSQSYPDKVPPASDTSRSL